jgi:T-complex protein 1 subunit zeta
MNQHKHFNRQLTLSWARGLQGQNDHSIAQIKDAVRDGLRAANNVLNDGAVVQGAGAFEIAAATHLRKNIMSTVQVIHP